MRKHEPCQVRLPTPDVDGLPTHGASTGSAPLASVNRLRSGAPIEVAGRAAPSRATLSYRWAGSTVCAPGERGPWLPCSLRNDEVREKVPVVLAGRGRCQLCWLAKSRSLSPAGARRDMPPRLPQSSRAVPQLRRAASAQGPVEAIPSMRALWQENCSLLGWMRRGPRMMTPYAWFAHRGPGHLTRRAPCGARGA